MYTFETKNRDVGEEWTRSKIHYPTEEAAIEAMATYLRQTSQFGWYPAVVLVKL